MKTGKLNAVGEITVDAGTGPSSIKLYATDGVHYLELSAPSTLTGNTAWAFPYTDGLSGQVLTTDGAGTLYWTNGGGGSVTSVGLTAGSSKVTITGTSPITSSGSFAVDINESNLNLDNIGGTLSVSKGGTGATSFTTNRIMLSGSSGGGNPLTTIASTPLTGSYLSWNGSNYVWAGVVTSVGLTSTTLTLSGSPITSSGNITVNLSTTGTAGTYKSVTTDVYGRVTGGTNPTTLAGFGITDAVNTSQLGANSGVATLDSGGKLTSAQIPLITITDTFVVASQAAMLLLTAQTGDVAVRTDVSKSFILKGTDPTVLTDWQELLTPTGTTTLTGDVTGSGAGAITTTLATVSTTKGGTGLTTYTTGDILYASATNVLSKLSVGTNGQILTLASGVPSWSTLNLATQTGLTIAKGDILYGSAAATVGNLAIGTQGQILVADASNTLTWSNTAGIAYTPTTPANWSSVPTQVQAALDNLAAAGGNIANKLTKGTLSIFCIDNGDYATLQDAINAATAGATIFVGPKSGGWGNVTLKAGVDLVGITAAQNTSVQIGIVSWNITTGNAASNRVNISNLYILGGISVTGSVVGRLRLDGCYVSVTSGAIPTISWSNNFTNGALLITDSTLISTTTGPCLIFSGNYGKLTNVQISGGTYAISSTSGNLSVTDCDVQYSAAGIATVQLTGSTIFNSVGTYITNSGSNGTGISIGTSATVAIGGGSSLAVSAGTGYAIGGTGTLLYDSGIRSFVPGNNTVFQNTLTQIYTGPTTLAGYGITNGVTSVGLTSSTLAVTGSPITNSGNITAELSTVGTPGTYVNVTTDTYGRVTSGVTSPLQTNTLTVYVQKNGSDVTGDGSIYKPYASIAYAMSTITDAAQPKHYTIVLGSGRYNEVNLTLKPWVWITGCGGISSTQIRITDTGGTVIPLALDSSWASSPSRGGLYNLYFINSGINFDTSGFAGTNICIIECQDVVFQGASTFKAHTAGDALFLYDCSFSSGGTTISGFVSTGGPTITSSVIYSSNFQGDLTLDNSTGVNAALNINACNITGNLYYTSTGTAQRNDNISSTAIYGNLVINNTSSGVMVLNTDTITLPKQSKIVYTNGTATINLANDAYGLGYTPVTPANWSSVPVTVQAALDTLASSSSADLKSYQTITSSVTITTSSKIYYVDASSGSIVITLPVANTITSGSTPLINIKRIDSTLATTVSIVRSSTDLIDGNTSYQLNNYQSVTLTTNSTNWFII